MWSHVIIAFKHQLHAYFQCKPKCNCMHAEYLAIDPYIKCMYISVCGPMSFALFDKRMGRLQRNEYPQMYLCISCMHTSLCGPSLCFCFIIRLLQISLDCNIRTKRDGVVYAAGCYLSCKYTWINKASVLFTNTMYTGGCQSINHVHNDRYNGYWFNMYKLCVCRWRAIDTKGPCSWYQPILYIAMTNVNSFEVVYL